MGKIQHVCFTKTQTAISINVMDVRIFCKSNCRNMNKITLCMKLILEGYNQMSN
jgi:hypothetical protein